MEKKVSKKLNYWIVFIAMIVLLVSGFLYNNSNTSTDINTLAEDKPLSMDAESFYPNKYMHKEFTGENENNNFIQIVEEVKDGKVQIKQVDSITNVVMIYDTSPKFVKLVYTKELDRVDSKTDYIEGLVPNREDYILKAPIEIGTNWSDETGGIFEIIKTNAIVDIPAGKFETVVVKYTNGEFTVKEFYARNIGLVKIILNNYEVYELKDIIY